MKARLKEIDLKLTELAKYLGMSRPTLYKFIELYENGESNQLTLEIKELFDLINKEIPPSKIQVINHIIKKSEEGDSVMDVIREKLNDKKDLTLYLELIRKILDVSEEKIDQVIITFDKGE